MVKLVGILNITPDSFSDGGQYLNSQGALKKARQLVTDGASIIDVGAESTRPGAQALTSDQEIARLSDFILKAKDLDLNISLDTYHPQTVAWASQHLSNFIINDITGFRNKAMQDIALKIDAQIIVSHLPLSSSSIEDAHKQKSVNSISQVVEELNYSISNLTSIGIKKNKIILDPGIGFGKTRKLNWELLKFAKYMPDYEVMIGYSRKRFLGDDRFEIQANFSAGKIAVEAGAKYLRVHDVLGHASLI